MIEPWPSVGHVYAQVAAEQGFNISPEELKHRFHTAWKTRKDFQHRRADWAHVVERTFGDLVPSGACGCFFNVLYDRFGEASAWRVFDDVRPTLGALRRCGLKLGVISNWDERLRPLLGKLGLTEFFEAIIISHEVGHLKPAKEIFLAAAHQLGLPPDAILHVGDSLGEDVEGAQAAGMQAFWLDRSKGLSLCSLPRATE